MADKPSGLRPPSKIGKVIPKAGDIKTPSTPSPVEPGKNDLKVGDKVLVSGNKSGRVQFLGPTQFAPGDWAGIVLDKEEGKNDGSVAGVRYFQCEPLHGIFARPAKLTRLDANGASSRASSIGSRPSSAEASAVKTAPLTAAALKAREGPKESRSKIGGVRSPASSIRSLRFGTPSRPANSTAPAGATTPDFVVGDKVIVNGAKIGFARFVGETEFAKGNWVGVELETAQGKNDGSVLGKRYFTCEMLYGLFAPLHKVKKLVPSTPRAAATKSAVRDTAASAAKRRTTGIRSPGSSVASVSSTSSFAAANRAKGLKSEVSSRYQRKTAPAGTSALQEALKEKQQHVESLMAEIDVERAGMMQASQDAALTKKELEDLSIQYQELVVEKENQLDALKQLVERADLEKVSLRQELAEEKTKVEDLQFRLEEEAINKDDMQVLGVDDKSALEHLTRERDTANALVAEFQARLRESETNRQQQTPAVENNPALELLAKEKDAADALVAELTDRLQEAEQKILQLQEQSRSSEEIDAFEDRISELLQEVEKMKMHSEDDGKTIESVKLQLEQESSEKASLQSMVSELKTENQKAVEECADMQFTINEAKTNFEEKSKLLAESQKQIELLQSEKSRLENQREDILKSSGDSSAQLMTLNKSIGEKDRTIELLHKELSQATSSLDEAKKERDAFHNSKSSLEVELNEMRTKLTESCEERSAFQSRVQDLEAETKTLTTKLTDTLSAQENVQSTLNNTEQEKSVIESRLEDLMQTFTSLQETLHQVQEERTALEKERDEAKTKMNEMEGVLDGLKNTCSEKDAEKDHLTKKFETMQNKVIELSEELDSLRKTHTDTKKTLSQMQEQSGEETKNLLLQLQEQREANEKQRAMVAESTKHMNEMLQQKIALEEVDKEHRSKILILEADTVNQKEEFRKLQEEHKSLSEIHAKLKAKLQRMEKSVPDSEERENVLKREFASERDSLQHTIDITTALVEEKRKESENYQQEIVFLKSENVLVGSLRESLRLIEQEKDELAFELKSMKASPLTHSASTEDSGVGDEDALRGQVDFLNSIIIDQQSKIAGLEEKIQELESMLLDGGDVDANEIAREFENEARDHKTRAAPRLFCDICDIFDAHDTDDCPTQSSMLNDTVGLPPTTHSATKRGEVRPYCENCEAFGHWTEDCSEEVEMY